MPPGQGKAHHRIQKDFSLHRDTAYRPTHSVVAISQIRKELDGVISGHSASAGKHIDASWPEQDILLETDPLLLSRILGNMVINALEATPESGTIRITVRETSGGRISWAVWNRTYIPGPIQKRIFQRYFSSKTGKGRGLGTYSMKLFGESYLKGRASFTSCQARGTTFAFVLPLPPDPPSTQRRSNH